MKEPNRQQWEGVCAGGYFAAAAVYLGNVLALAAVRGGLALTLVFGAFPVVCAAVGCLVLAGKRWVPRWAVVVAAAFAAIHLVGLADLFFVGSESAPLPTRALQWQLGAAFLFIWVSVLLAAFRLARCADRPAA